MKARLTLMFICLPIIVLLFSCSGQRILPTEYEKAQIEFGNGGGFTGAIQKYYLQQSGALYQYNPYTLEFIELDFMKRSRAKGYFSKYDSLTAEIDSFYHPSNSYFFMNYSEQDTKRTIVWGKGDFPVDSELRILYDSLMHDVRTAKTEMQEENEKNEEIN